jgi:hypothetical protein
MISLYGLNGSLFMYLFNAISWVGSSQTTDNVKISSI